jgi:hypothetical protein
MNSYLRVCADKFAIQVKECRFEELRRGRSAATENLEEPRFYRCIYA